LYFKIFCESQTNDLSPAQVHAAREAQILEKYTTSPTHIPIPTRNKPKIWLLPERRIDLYAEKDAKTVHKSSQHTCILRAFPFILKTL
jgi:SOS-response transcriptional repressor LexA